MNLKLKNEWELGMYYEGKKKGMSEYNIETSIKILRIIQEMK